MNDYLSEIKNILTCLSGDQMALIYEKMRVENTVQFTDISSSNVIHFLHFLLLTTLTSSTFIHTSRVIVSFLCTVARHDSKCFLLL